jgi:protein-L-isoaspartate O-methyltransferase
VVTEERPLLAEQTVGATPALQPRKLVALHCATVFLSAFLLFSLQPMMGRLILPFFGGSAAVWSACMLFFQAALLAGYGYADWISLRLTPRQQGRLHAAFLVVGLILLPIRLSPALGTGHAPALGIALILAAGIGVPYLLLSATSPLVQLWYARATGMAPYRLYALSNVASLLALVAYPTLVEPNVTVHGQLTIWSVGFGLFAALCGASALLASRQPALTAVHTEEAAPRPSLGTCLLWILLAAIPSTLLLAATNHLCQNVAAIPFLWVAPLAAYLLSLILCFDYDSVRRHLVFLWLTPVALIGMGYVSLFPNFTTNLLLTIPLYTVGLFVVCMAFHGELVHRKPHASRSTAFYLMVAVGGALGGVLIVIVAPRVLSGVYELPILMTTASMFLMMMYYRRHWYLDVFWAAVSITLLVFSMAQISSFSAHTRIAMRNFYGALRVVDTQLPDGTVNRALVHGTISHGNQFQDAARSRHATTYYAPGTGAWFALDALRSGPQSAGLIGLGAGTLAAYVKPGDHYTYYELNPQVIDLARREFTYLNVAGVEVVEGDGRLALAKDSRSFDVLVLDAFSGDSIPTHLLTREAMAVYLSHLRPDGILAMHISNSVLDLESPVAKLAQAAGLSAVLVHTPSDDKISRSEAVWVLMTRTPARFENAELAKVARPMHAKPAQRLWTDDYSNLFQLLKSQ